MALECPVQTSTFSALSNFKYSVHCILDFFLGAGDVPDADFVKKTIEKSWDANN